MLDITLQELLTIIQLASKACEFEWLCINGIEEVGRWEEAKQFKAACFEASMVLAEIDKANPGVIPVPHDGVQWKDRVE
jgi:hypothetical protein